MTTQASLDYTKLSTWENMDYIQTCLRISERNAGAITASATVYNAITNNKVRAALFFQCETLGIKGWKFYTVFKECCGENLTQFMKCVMKSEQVMFATIKKYEEKEK
jgi:hypothetical protein